MSDLTTRQCVRIARGSAPLAPEARAALLAQVPGWSLDAAGDAIVREFRFANYDQTVAFVNAVAAIARQQDHHPDVCFTYNRCTVRYTTHAAHGLTENDFICAAKIDALPA